MLTKPLLPNIRHRLDTISPEACKFILADFDHLSMDKSLKYVTCATRIHKTLDKCYGPVLGAYSSLGLPPLGLVDDNIILLAWAHMPVVKWVERKMRTVKTWTLSNIEALQGCFDCTTWELFLDSSTSLDEQAFTTSKYITFCVDSVIHTKQITAFPNNTSFERPDLASNMAKVKHSLIPFTTLTPQKSGCAEPPQSHCNQNDTALTSPVMRVLEELVKYGYILDQLQLGYHTRRRMADA